MFISFTYGEERAGLDWRRLGRSRSPSASSRGCTSATTGGSATTTTSASGPWVRSRSSWYYETRGVFNNTSPSVDLMVSWNGSSEPSSPW